MSKRRVEAKLEEELGRLRAETGLGSELSVKWAPKPDSDRHGEVIGTAIYVYDVCEDRALLTVKHEFLDYHITKEVIDPLVKFINIEKCLIEDLVYDRKERLVKRFLKLL